MLVAAGVVLTVVAVFALGLFVRAPRMRHKPLTPEKLQSLLRTLLTYGRPGALLLIQVRKQPSFVQFRIDASGRKKGLQAGFPRAPWSEAVFERVLEDLGGRGIPVRRQPEPGPQVTEFALGDFGSDIEAAQEHASTVLRDILRADPERECYAVLEGDFD